ncbi:MAG: hypothetical protein IKK21_09350 [Clostridia bacterium]|nr:hypothetical protein [Clostridia bacterium]
MADSIWWVDRTRHELHHGDSIFPCDRGIEAFAVWQEQALLLSSETDCLSLWDQDGLVRLTRVGVYPQDMAVADDVAVVCGGADCKLHLLELPGLYPRTSFLLPGMPERIALQDASAHILALVTEPEIHTQLLLAELHTGRLHTQMKLPGIPGAIAADADGLWLGVSGQVMHLRRGTIRPDVTVEGIEMPERIDVCPGGIVVADALSARSIRVLRDDEKKGALTLR